MALQMDEKEKEKLADYVIENNTTEELLFIIQKSVIFPHTIVN